VAAARAGTAGLLLTYVAEIGTLYRQVFGVRISADGSVREEADILAYTDEGETKPPWPRDRIDAARPAAEAIARRHEQDFTEVHAARAKRDTDTALAWLGRRADALCGRATARTGDLFGHGLAMDGRQPNDPVSRLAALTADASVERARRQDAVEALRRYRAMAPEPVALPPVTTRLIGVLFLLP